MRRWPATLGLVCAISWSADRVGAQPTTNPGYGAGAGTAAMPGQVVGSGFTLNQVGSTITKAAPQAGIPIGNPNMRPYDPARPLDVFKGTSLDPNSVVAPVSGFPSIPTQQPDLLTQLYQKLTSVTAFFAPNYSAPPRTFTPGIFRRDRERAKKWRPD